MVIKVPRVIRSALLICQRDYSLLGFGDILVPGKFTKHSDTFSPLHYISSSPHSLLFIHSITSLFLLSSFPSLTLILLPSLPSFLYPLFVLSSLSLPLYSFFYPFHSFIIPLFLLSSLLFSRLYPSILPTFTLLFLFFISLSSFHSFIIGLFLPPFLYLFILSSLQ